MVYVYCIVYCALCYCSISFYFVIFVLFSSMFLFSCPRGSFVDVPLIFSRPTDHVQYRIGKRVVYHWAFVWLRPDPISSSVHACYACCYSTVHFVAIVGVGKRGARIKCSMVITYGRERFFPCPRSRLRIWSRKTGLAAPSRVSLLILHTQQANLVLYSRNFPPAFRDY